MRAVPRSVSARSKLRRRAAAERSGRAGALGAPHRQVSDAVGHLQRLSRPKPKAGVEANRPEAAVQRQGQRLRTFADGAEQLQAQAPALRTCSHKQVEQVPRRTQGCQPDDAARGILRDQVAVVGNGLGLPPFTDGGSKARQAGGMRLRAQRRQEAGHQRSAGGCVRAPGRPQVQAAPPAITVMPRRCSKARSWSACGLPVVSRRSP